MPNPIILADRIGKKFHRTLSGSFWHSLRKLVRKALRLKPDETLGKDEFWALRDVSFIVQRGECLGIIGPNGAGKSTLLKLIHRKYHPDTGRILALGSTQSLIHNGGSLQPLLSGRENILIQCQQLGLNAREAEAKLDGIVAFAELEQAIDAPVKTYSDGMCARLEFAIATSVPADIVLVDEVLAVGDIAFQIRALDRLNELKRHGAAIVFVSHSEMNVRYLADRCLLLFNGRQVALGEPDALFYQYYESVGYLNPRLQPLNTTAQGLKEVALGLAVLRLDSLAMLNGEDLNVGTGEALELRVEYRADSKVAAVSLVLHFWNSAGMLVACVDSEPTRFRLDAGTGGIQIRIPYVALTPGHYRLAAGFRELGQWRAYRQQLLDLYVTQHSMVVYQGLAVLQAFFIEADNSHPRHAKGMV